MQCEATRWWKEQRVEGKELARRVVRAFEASRDILGIVALHMLQLNHPEKVFSDIKIQSVY